ncbi:calpain-15-like isoform X2 [Crassostrea angulata]|uniref:calpain-15-like isoform X1 n=1 Tax=Magallana angulata TaxID=2784310 RepID=UPI0022B218C9|nr:calpain-15-like isoform X1 [Crassostrea angulata]XP_052719564.1 calpain-15-like isoform X2 [Crassostrea angulata]
MEMFNKLFKHKASKSNWMCHKCKNEVDQGEKCKTCQRWFNKKKDEEVGSTRKEQNSKEALDGATSHSGDDQVNRINCDVGEEGGIETVNSSGWTCKICYMSGNQSTECKMCKQTKKELSDEDNIKNRRKRKNLNRSRLKAGHSLKVKDERDKQKKVARDIARNITDYCKENNIHYEDRSFPASNDPKRDEERWIRIGQIEDNSCRGKGSWKIFRNPSPDDAIQGAAENCWFLCAVSLLSQKEELLKDIFITESFCEEGLYQVRLCKDGNWKTVIVDDRFPCDKKGNLKYSRSQNKQLWVMLLEKAAAKLYGGYEALHSGLVVESLAMLTGEPCEHIDLKGSDEEKEDDNKLKLDLDKLWTELKAWHSSRYLIGISTPEDLQQGELESSHCYPVLEVQEMNDTKLMKLWTCSDHKHCITGCLTSNVDLQKEKKRLLRNLKTGEFWISFEDEFIKYFNSLSVCKTDEGWFESRFKGVFPPVLSKEWKYYSFRLVNDTKLKLGLFQKSMRGTGLKIEAFTDLLIMVLRNQDDGSGHPFMTAPLFSEVMSYSKRRARSLTTCNVDLTQGSYTVACFSFGKLRQDNNFEAEDYVSYTLSMHSSVQLHFVEEVNASSFPELMYASADALITLAKQSKIKENGVKISDIDAFNIADGVYYVKFWFYGQMCVFINETTEGYSYLRNYRDSEYILDVRNRRNTLDYIPHKSGRVINIVTPQNPETSWTIATQSDYKKSEPLESSPPVPDTLKGLLTPRPIPEISSSS